MKKGLLDYVFLLIFYCTPILAIVWACGMLSQLVLSDNLDILISWAEISFTIFGFCLVGGIFEKNRKGVTKITKDLFQLSIIFFFSGIAFLMLNSIFYIPTIENPFTKTIIDWTITIMFISSIWGFVYGIWIMFLRLFKHLIETKKKENF
jgi:hypothetical protein